MNNGQRNADLLRDYDAGVDLICARFGLSDAEKLAARSMAAEIDVVANDLRKKSGDTGRHFATAAAALAMAFAHMDYNTRLRSEPSEAEHQRVSQLFAGSEGK